MKRVLIGAALLMLASAGTLDAAQRLSSTITEATIYFDQARVFRQGSAALEQGRSRLIIPVEAFFVDSDSVTADIKAKGEILGVRVTEVPAEEPGREKIRELENRLSDLDLKKRKEKDRIRALEKQQAFLDSVVKFSETQIPADIKTSMPSEEMLDSTLKFLGNRYSTILDEKREAENKTEDLEKQIRTVKRELDMLRGRNDDTRTCIEITFKSEKPQEAEIKVGYTVKDAGWSPVYRAMAKDTESDINLSMLAEITQKTGEDWDDAYVTVSTAEPAKGGRLPELSPWYLDTGGIIREKASDDARMLKARAPEAEENNAAAMAEARKKETAISFEYTAKEPATIPSRQEKTLLPVFAKTIQVDYHYRAVPKADPRAYLACEAEADKELLAGPVSTFFGGRYTGTMFLEEKEPGRPFVLALGPDPSVSVTRRKTQDNRKETSFFGKIEKDSVARQIKYIIEAENLKQRPVSIRIYDHVPVSKTDRIKVENIEFDPEPDTKDADGKQGVMLWRTELEPGRSKKIAISFTVAYPKDMPPPVF